MFDIRSLVSFDITHNSSSVREEIFIYSGVSMANLNYAKDGVLWMPQMMENEWMMSQDRM